MSKGIVECVHWDPEVDTELQATRKKNKIAIVIFVVVVALVATGVSLLLFGPPKSPAVDPADLEQATQEDGEEPPGLTEYGIDAEPKPEPDSELARGIELYGGQQYQEAIAALTMALFTQPESREAYKLRGMSYFQLSQYPEAIQDFTQTLRYSSNDPATTLEIITLRGGSHYLAGLYTEAISDLSRAIELNPDNTQAYDYRARAFEATGQHALAQADYQKSESLKSNIMIAEEGTP